jgi:GT2 family glycosyltransferase/SAM-dependent methyltransferase
MARVIENKKVKSRTKTSDSKLVSVVIVSKDRKKDLVECIDSYLNSSYKPLEIIVVDNNSKPPLITWLPKKYPKVKLISLDQNVGAAEGRNIGFRESNGSYIIFTDDDAYASKDMVNELVKAFKETKNPGIIQPLVYDKQKKSELQGAGHNFDLLTGRLTAWGVREKDNGQYEGIREVPMCGCVWMVKREVFDRIGEYDENYFIPYEDSDFSICATKAGFKNYAVSSAKTYHQGVKKTFVHPRLEYLGITSPQRAYRTMRNKLMFMRKHSPFPQNLVFFLILTPLYIFAHTLIILTTFRLDVLFMYWGGVVTGLLYALLYPFRYLKHWYTKTDKDLLDFKMWLLAWTDPLPWVIDKKTETILDLACGQGKPMEMIKIRMPIKKAVGVDLFEPYIKEAREKKIHDEYVLKDIRKIDYKDNSFDVVIASHVLEHMPEKDAWKLLAKMEKIAKKQVIIATPIGEMYHPPVDSNELQLHHCHFYPKDYEKRGYKTVKYGWRWLLGDEGIVHKVRNDFIRKILYTFNILATPIYYGIQPLCDYTFVAYKDVSNKKLNAQKNR